jgi:hypothetical protein
MPCARRQLLCVTAVVIGARASDPEASSSTDLTGVSGRRDPEDSDLEACTARVG